MRNFFLKAILLIGAFVLFASTQEVAAQSDKIPFADHYKGGVDSLLHDIKEIMVYPPNAKRNRVQGKSIVFVTLEADGSFSQTSLVKKIGAGCDSEAIRIVKELQNTGKIIAPGYKANYQIPIHFKL